MHTVMYAFGADSPMKTTTTPAYAPPYSKPMMQGVHRYRRIQPSHLPACSPDHLLAMAADRAKSRVLFTASHIPIITYRPDIMDTICSLIDMLAEAEGKNRHVLCWQPRLG